MSASYFRPKLTTPLADKLTASLKVDTSDSILFAAVAVAGKQLDGIDRTMFQRVNNDAPAANHLVLDELRRIADALKEAADKYQWGVQ